MAKPPKERVSVPASEFNLGERLRYLRTLRGLSQAQLAQGAKLSQPTVAHIETGRKDPSIQTLKSIARFLDIEIAALFATDDVHVFDLRRLRRKYNSADKLTPHLYAALGKVIQYAKDIGYIKD